MAGAVTRPEVRPMSGLVRAPRLPAVSRALGARLLLVSGCVLAAAGAVFVADPAARAAVEPDLARLLRGMALLKAAIVLGAFAAVAWRLGHPIGAATTAVYLAGVWGMAGAGVLVWQLSWLPLAAVVFHAAEIALVVTAWRDGAGAYSSSRPSR